MKKALSLLMALAILCTLSISAFAAEDDTGGTTLNGGTVDIAPFSADDVTGDNDAITPQLRTAWSGNDKITFTQGDLLFATDDDPTKAHIILPEAHLEPNTEYTFRVYYAAKTVTDWDVATDGTSVAAINAAAADSLLELKKSDLGDDARLRVRASKNGSVIKSTDIKTKGVGADTLYRVVIETKDLYNTKQTEVTYTFSISGTPDTTGLTGDDSDTVFLVGHGIMSDDDIESYGEEEEVDVSNDTPIFKKKQIETLVKENNYKAITLIASDDSWEYTGRMNGMGDTNFYYTQDVVPSIMNKFDQDFKFLIFPAGVTFPTNGEMRIDVSDVSDTWDKMYTYLYRNGKLTRINTTYDSNDDVIVFRTNYLGAFVMTDVEITDTSIIEQPGDTSEPESPAPEPSSPGSGTGTGTGNPNTGLPMGMNLLAGLGGVTLLSAGSIIIRKRK